MNILHQSKKISRSTVRRSDLSKASISEREWKERRSASDRKWQVYPRNTEHERQALAERQAAEGMLDLDDGICVCQCSWATSTNCTC
jgi:hypothetical protein